MLIADLMRHPALSAAHLAKADVMSITLEKDIDRKKRFEAEASPDGSKVRCLQGHTLPVTRVNVSFNRPNQRYLIHAAKASAAAEILRTGMKQMKNQKEFHFVELNYDSRQSKYLINHHHVSTKMIRLASDTPLAE